MRLIRKKSLLNKISFIDGLPGSGKSLVAPLISATKKNDLWLLNHNYEYLIYLYSIKKINFDVVKVLLNIWADKDINDLYLGRNVNFRASDDSSVFKNHYLKIIKNRFLLKKKNNKKKTNLLIMTHNLFFLRKKFKNIFSKFEFICVLRHPYNIINQFNVSSWKRRYQKDPNELSITYLHKKKIYPWFINIKNKLNFYDSFVDFVCDYTLAVIKEKKVKKIFFEEFINYPRQVLKKNKMNQFKSLQNSFFLMKKLNLPRNQKFAIEEKNINQVLRKIKSNSLKKKFLKISHLYKNLIK